MLSFFKLPKLELAEDIVQSTFLAALSSWSEKGLPRDPVGWLFKVCKNKAINELYQEKNRAKTEFSPPLQEVAYYQLEQAFLPSEIRDNQLRLLFAACHPDFSSKSSLILVLKTLAGFKVEEIAKGLGMHTEAVKKNLVRTKRQILEQNMQLKVPLRMQSRERLAIIHQVLYLIFNEGYRASAGERIIKMELCMEALRMTRSLLDEEKISNSDTQALFALMLFHIARFRTRTDMEGEIIGLKQQDRSLWDRDLIHQALKHFNQSKKEGVWSKYHFEAAIASIHCLSPTFEETNWLAIVKLYDGLLKVNSSGFVHLNRSIALHYAGESFQALNEIRRIQGFGKNPLYLIALAEIFEGLGRIEEALQNLLEALEISSLDSERKFLQKKINGLQEY